MTCDDGDWLLDFAALEDHAVVSAVFVDFGDVSDHPGDANGEAPEATFDTLLLVSKLERQAAPGRLELHNFAYLACLVSVFDGRPASGWGYSFSAVPPTLPFSPAIEKGLEDLESAGLVLVGSKGPDTDEPTDEVGGRSVYRLSGDGREELALLARQSIFAGRLPYLEAASATAVLMSLPAVVSSMTLEPELMQATQASSDRLLLRTNRRGPLYAQFAALREVLGPEHADLIVPASLYIRFLNQQALRILGDGDE